MKFTDYYEEIEEIDPSRSREQNLESLRDALRVWRRRQGDEARIKESLINRAIEVFSDPKKDKEFRKWWEERQAQKVKVSPEQKFRGLVHGAAMDRIITFGEYQNLLREAKRKGISEEDAKDIIQRIADEDGATINEAVVQRTPEIQHEEFYSRGEKRPWLAALLSFFIVGSGQIYNGQIGKGIGLIIASVFFWVVGLSISIAFFISFLISIIIIILWIYGIYDAYKTANKINAGEMIA